MNWFRGAVFLVLMTVTTILMGLVLAPTLLMGQNAARAVGKLWARTVLAELRFIAGVAEEIEGAENIPTGPAIVAANHQSMWETLFLFARLPRPAVIFKKELADVPVFGWWLTRTGSILIDRSEGVKAIRTMTKTAEARLGEGAQIIIFPEGTRAPPGETGRLQPGVAALYKSCNAPVVAIGHDSGLYWSHPGLEKTPGRVKVRVAEPIAPGLDKKEFLSRLTTALHNARPDLPPAVGSSTATQTAAANAADLVSAESKAS